MVAWLRSDGGVSVSFTDLEVACAARHLVEALEGGTDDVPARLDSGGAELQISLATFDCFDMEKMIRESFKERGVGIREVDCLLEKID